MEGGGADIWVRKLVAWGQARRALGGERGGGNGRGEEGVYRLLGKQHEMLVPFSLSTGTPRPRTVLELNLERTVYIYLYS